MLDAEIRLFGDEKTGRDQEHVLGPALVKPEADAFDALPHEDEIVYRQDIFVRVWKEAEEQRISGELLTLGRQIHCPVIAIHGDYDPHPAEGVWLPLSRVLEDFTFIQLEKCGHKPWVEKHARDKFYEVLEKLLA